MAATAVPDTGHGASITLGTTGGTWKCRKITPGEATLPMVDTTYLGTTVMRTKMAGDLYEWTDAIIEILFQGTQGLPAMGTSETITITSPIPGGSASTAPSLAGTGTIHQITYPELMTNELQIGRFAIAWNGSTPPSFTAAT